MRESIWAGAQCAIPPWAGDDVASRAVEEVRRRLNHLVVDEWQKAFDYDEDGEDYEDEEYEEDSEVEMDVYEEEDEEEGEEGEGDLELCG